MTTVYALKINESDQNLRLVLSTIQKRRFKSETTTSIYDIGHNVQVRFKLNSGTEHIATSAAFKVHESLKDLKVQIYVTCNINSVTKYMICPHEWSDYVAIGEHSYNTWNDETYLSVLIADVTVDAPSWHILYNDNFTDFHLSAEGSSIPVHRVVMADHSEVFKTMLNGEWKETAKDCLELKETSQQTLRHLKDFMYLGSLPEHEDLHPLLLIAKCYMMHRLEVACVDKMVWTVKPEHLLDLIKYAADNHLPELSFSIMKKTSSKVVNDSEST